MVATEGQKKNEIRQAKGFIQYQDIVTERPIVRGVSSRSRDGALSRKECAANGKMTITQATVEYAPLPATWLHPPAFSQEHI